MCVHEVSLIEDVIGLIEEERRKQDFLRVRVIRLRVGKLGHVEPEALRFCFDAVALGTIAEGARLDIVMVAGQGQCLGCGQLVAMDDRFGDCPLCGDARVKIIAGDELRLAEMEVE